MLAESPHTSGTVYMTAARHKTGDYAPYVYKTTDLGTTWTRIDAGLPQHEFCRVIREDPNREGLLYVGTELGIHVSFDDGASWQSLQCNLPVTPDLRLRREGHRPRRGDARPFVLDPRRPDAAAPDARRPADGEPLPARSHATSSARPRTSPRRGEARPAARTTTSPRGQNATFYVDELETGHVRKRVIDAGDDLERGVRIMYFLEEAAVGEASLTIATTTATRSRRSRA